MARRKLGGDPHAKVRRYLDERLRSLEARFATALAGLHERALMVRDDQFPRSTEEAEEWWPPTGTVGVPHGLQLWPKGLPLPLTVGDALRVLESERETLIDATATEIWRCVETLIPEERREAVFTRRSVSEGWPWSRQYPSVTMALNQLQRVVAYMAAQSRAATRAPMTLRELRATLGRTSPPANIDVARWTAARIEATDRDSATKLVQWTETLGRLPDLRICDQYGTAIDLRSAGLPLLQEAEQAVLEDARKPMMAIDTSDAHHGLISLWGTAIGASNYPLKKRGEELILLPPSGVGRRVPVQLTLPHFATFNEQWVEYLKQWRKPEALRHWAAMLRLFSVEGARTGRVTWTMDAHLDAIGASPRLRGDRDKLEAIASLVELFTKFELAVRTPDGRFLDRYPLIKVERYRDIVLEDGHRRLDNFTFEINRAIYSGVRDFETSRIGSSWCPAPVELAQIDHYRNPYAIEAGLKLAPRFRWAFRDERSRDNECLRLSRQSWLAVAGIRSKYRHRADETLFRTIDKLQEITLLDRVVWDEDGEMSTVYPGEWIVERLTGRTPVVEVYQTRLPQTGGEFKSWREAKGWTQHQAADVLSVGRRTIARAETEGADRALSKSMREAVVTYAK